MNRYNVTQMVDRFIPLMYQQANKTRGDHILITYGSDFQFRHANDYFGQIDKLIKYVQADGRVDIFYSHPEKYVAAKEAEEKANSTHMKKKSSESLADEKKNFLKTADRNTDESTKSLEGKLFPSKYGDFFPYADRSEAYWTGYFTSRPGLKRMIRDYSNKFQVFKAFDALSLSPGSGSELNLTKTQLLQDNMHGSDDWDQGLWQFADAMGIVQHHDAVSGTAKQHTTFDYQKRVNDGYKAAGKTMLSDAMFETLGMGGCNVDDCVLGANETRCSSADVNLFGDQRRHVIEANFTKMSQELARFAVWNNLGQSRTSWLQVPLETKGPDGGRVEVYSLSDDSNGDVVETLITKSYVETSENVKSNYGVAAGSQPYRLLFEAELPALGFGTYVVRTIQENGPKAKCKHQTSEYFVFSIFRLRF